MEKFLIRANAEKDKGFIYTEAVKDYLEKHGKAVIVEKMNSSNYSHEEPLEDNCEELDCVIVLGGDGTMLRAARDFVNTEIPLFGVNLGTVGYLTEASKDDNLYEALDKLIIGEYEIEDRMMLEGELIREGHSQGHAIALNDIVVSKDKPFQAINFEVYVNEQFLTDYNADGIIISTPTGSTGYNLSAGGPIVEPPASLMVMTPVSPHTLNSRSIILSAQDEVSVRITDGKEGTIQTAIAMADSVNRFEMKSKDCFNLRKSKKSVKFIKTSRESFLKVLHDKLK